MMLRSNPGSLLQKTYDDCYLMCSTAVYFEKQNSEDNALRSWRNSLESINRHHATLSPTYNPQNETERSLQNSIRDLEILCKERIDLLGALQESRKIAGLEAENGALGPRDTSGGGRNQMNTDTQSDAPGWLGGGTIPSASMPDLPKPKLPARPQHRSSDRGSSTGTPPDLSRTTSSEKKKLGFLSTLRGSRDKKSSPEGRGLPVSRPVASKAADLAWTSLRPPGPAVTTSAPAGEFAARKSMDSGPRPEPPPKKPEFTSERLACGAAALASRRPVETESTAEDTNSISTFPRRRASKEAIAKAPVPISKPAIPPPEYPTYRKEFPDTGTGRLAAPIRPRSSNSVGASVSQPAQGIVRGSPRAPRPSDRRMGPRAPNSGQKPGQNMRPAASSMPVNKAAAKASPKGRGSGLNGDREARETSRSPNKTPDSISESSDEEDPFAEEMERDRDFRNIMNNLPKGVDRTAAGQILNEIVVRGDVVEWDDIAGLEVAKKALKEAVVYPFLRPDLFMGLREPTTGMLLFGPPGTGKTMLARGVATESKSTFFSISATSLTSKWHGESEKLVRALFALAKAMAPSIIFVDEIDSLLSSRLSGDHEATRRSKTQFLIEWSDLQRAAAGREQSTKGKMEGDPTRVLVLGATNMPWDIDDAARRRFIRRQYIPLPEAEVRKVQFRKLLSHQKHELSEDDLDALVKLTDGFSGSDITALAKDAAMGPLRNLGEALLSTPMDEICPIRFKDFEASLYSIRPSISRQRLSEYEKWAQDYGERGS